MKNIEQENEDTTFYFFVENEFVCQRNNDLMSTADEDEVFSSYAITVNFMNFSTNQNENQDPKVNKIYSSFSDTGFNKNQMYKVYRKAEEYIELNFALCENNSKVFIGCVRDDNNTHKFCTKDYLKFSHWTDPFHDIFNILKHIYTNENLKVNNLQFNYGDLEWFLDFLRRFNPSVYNLLPKVGYFDLNKQKSSKEENLQKIWIPNKKSVQLEKFISPLRHLFSMNYFERLFCEAKLFPSVSFKWLLEFILLLKKILNFVENDFINEDTFKTYYDLYIELREYSFMKKNIRCLNSLTETMQTNIKFYKVFQVPFKPKWFSTQGIEAEKGHLRYKSKNYLPTIDHCKEWFNKTMCEGIDSKMNLMGCSEFGEYHLRFDPLPEGSTILY